MYRVVSKIQKAQSIILSTHTQPDGDGLGAQMALYRALAQTKKELRIVNVDASPSKYSFLNPDNVVETIIKPKKLIRSDIALIFDTNDPDLLPSLYDELKSNCGTVIFVDHHPILDRHPLIAGDHYIDVASSSTGQMVFELIKALGLKFDDQIAQALYTAIIFDTNFFRYIRGSPKPHLIAAELLEFNIEPEIVHRHLFGNHTPTKLKFLSQVLGHIEFECDGKLACIPIKKSEIEKLGLEIDDARDVIDMVMNVKTIEAAVLIREDGPKNHKLSFRSKGVYSVGALAQSLGGGGHKFASGAYMNANYSTIKARVLEEFSKLFLVKEKIAVAR